MRPWATELCAHFWFKIALARQCRPQGRRSSLKGPKYVTL